MLNPFLFEDEVNAELEDYIGATLQDCNSTASIVNMEHEVLEVVMEMDIFEK